MSTMNYEKKNCIVVGVSEGLSQVPHHRDIQGIERVLLLSARLLPGAPIHVAGHLVGKSLASHGGQHWEYAEAHKHEFDEVNIVWSETGELLYRIEIDGEVFEVRSPSAVFVPAGATHRAEAVSGQGSFFCILLKPNTSESTQTSTSPAVKEAAE